MKLFLEHSTLECRMVLRRLQGDFVESQCCQVCFATIFINSVVLLVSPTYFLIILRTPTLWICSRTSYDYPVSVANIYRELHKRGLALETSLFLFCLSRGFFCCTFELLSEEHLYLNTALYLTLFCIVFRLYITMHFAVAMLDFKSSVYALTGVYRIFRFTFRILRFCHESGIDVAEQKKR